MCQLTPPLVCLEVWVAVRNLFRRWLTRTCWSRYLMVTSGWRRSLTLPVTFTCCTRRLTVDILQQHAAKCSSYTLSGSPYHGYSTNLVAFFFGKSWHVSVDVCSITNELFLGSVILTMWHAAKRANINNLCVTRFTCIFVNSSNSPPPQRTVILKNYLFTRKTIEQHFKYLHNNMTEIY